MGYRILSIMPKIKLRTKYTEFLKEMGFEIFIQENLQLAASSARRFKPDLVLGYEDLLGDRCPAVSKGIKQAVKNEGLPFLLVSPKAYTDESPKIDFAELNIDDMISMPFEQGDLYKYVTHWLESDNPAPLSTMMLVDSKDDPEQKNKASAEMADWQKGYGGLMGIAKLLYSLVAQVQTGKLMIRGERRKMAAWIENGVVVDVQSNYMRDDTLGRYLISINKLSEKQNEQALEYASNQSIPQGKAIVKMGIIDKDSMKQHLTDHKILKLMNIFQRRWYDSKFIFKPGPVDLGKTIFNHTPLAKILARGIMNVARKTDIYNCFVNRSKLEVVLEATGTFDDLVRKLDLGPALYQQAMGLSGHTIKQVGHNHSDKFGSNVRIAFLILLCMESEKLQPANQIKQPAKIPRSTESTAGVAGDIPCDANIQALEKIRKHIEQQQFPQAIDQLDCMASENPDDKQILTMLAWTKFIYKGKQNPKIALDCVSILKKVIQSGCEQSTPYLYLGKILKNLGKKSESEPFFLQAHKLDPDDKDAKREAELIQIKRRKNKPFIRS